MARITKPYGRRVHLPDPQSAPTVGRIINRRRSLCGLFGNESSDVGAPALPLCENCQRILNARTT